MDSDTPQAMDGQSAPLMPWETLYPKQLKVFNCAVEEEAERLHPNCPALVLVEGPRYTGKTIAVGHRVCRHLWETRAARVGLVVKTAPSALDGGVWNDLTDIVMPTWIGGNIGFEYTTFDRNGVPGPCMHPKSRSLFFRVRNAHGGESELYLLSLQHDQEVKPRLKSSRWSCLWFSELSNFRDAAVLKVSWEQLRMFHLKKYQHLWISDTNPSDEGADSWIWQLWFKQLEILRARGDEYGRSLRRISFRISDNMSISDQDLKIREAHYEDNDGERDRELKGLWVKGQGKKGKHFGTTFSREIHVIGGPNDGIQIGSNTTELFTGWDIGTGANHSAGIIEKRWVPNPATGLEWPMFCILESITHIDESIPVSALGMEMMERIMWLQDRTKRKFEWIHYADDSAINSFRSASGTTDDIEIRSATDGFIELIGVPKPENSVMHRVMLVKRFLRQRRLFVAGKCHDVIDMFENLGHGTKRSDYIIWNQYKHVFDWISYVLYMEVRSDLINDVMAVADDQSGHIDLSVDLA